MQEHTRYLKLPFQFDEKKLVQELSVIFDHQWIPHFNENAYSGDWKVISLYAEGGDNSNIFARPNSTSPISETQVLKRCPYYRAVINSFKFPILTARILRLGVGAEIKPHRDHDLGYENGNFRLHIPITTNPNVEFILDGDRLTMLPGECWYTNVNYIHSVKNAGNQDRLHIVIDGKSNEWSDQLFFSLAPPESFRPIPRENDSPETIKRTIEELQRSNAPIAQQLIDQMLQKLAEINKTTL